MGPHFLPRLVNGPFEDPALFVPFRHEKRAFLFDLGDIAALSSRDILKVTHIFVSHTHMDHFAGFDRALRLMLGRDKDLFLFGPQGFLANVTGKLAGYCWNLVESYQNRFTLHVSELHPDHALLCSYPCHRGFIAASKITQTPFDGTVLDEPAVTVRAVHLDHGTPVLAYVLDERFHVSIRKSALDRLEIPSGPWLGNFKTLLYENAHPDTPVEVPSPHTAGGKVTMTLDALRKTIAHISAGQRLAYIVDAAGTPANQAKMIALAKGADHLFVEAAFSHQHREIARKKRHLTARQAGELARACEVKRYTLFHHSPRYSDCPQLLKAEAEAAFSGRSR